MRFLFKIIIFVSFYAIVLFVALYVGRKPTPQSILLKTLIAWVAVEAIGILLNRVSIRGCQAIERGLFWLIQVVPTNGANAEEAQGIVRFGRRFELWKKLGRDINNWTPEDTLELVSLDNWRARLFFSARRRIRVGRLVTELKHICAETGEEPRDISKEFLDQIALKVPGVKIPWYETFIVDSGGLVFFTLPLIVLVIWYASR
jgi:hypothetical protein